LPGPTQDYLPEERLAVYGSLQPGERNAHMLAPLEGTWTAGIVRGTLHPIRDGYARGYIGLRLGAGGDEVPVAMLSSRGLPAFWATLDEFEGPEFVRTIADVEVGDSLVEASLYEWRP
jgi:gamma-glutamylcyclotransferase (GGCT)/AIG2-like uncharacterized protein YtfP